MIRVAVYLERNSFKRGKERRSKAQSTPLPFDCLGAQELNRSRESNHEWNRDGSGSKFAFLAPAEHQGLQWHPLPTTPTRDEGAHSLGGAQLVPAD